MSPSDLLIRRNKLMTKILWAISIVLIGFNMLSKSEGSRVALFIIGPSLTIISGVITLLV